MAEAKWYHEWFGSPYYHKLYWERDEEEAEVFIARLAEHLRIPPGSRILDLGCGKGRHSRVLATMGHQVTGIDLSPENIEFAKRFENENLEFYVHDLRLPFRTNYFDFAFNFFTSFGYFGTRREHEDAIRTISNGLKPGGILVMDYLNTHYTEHHLVPKEEIRQNGTLFSIRRWDDDSHFYKKISITDPELPESLTFTEQVAKFNLGDFTDMFSFQGLQVTEVFGNYGFGPYDITRTPRLILIARKKKNEADDSSKRLYSDGRPGDALT